MGRQQRAVLDEQLDDPADCYLLGVRQAGEPGREFIRTFDVPRHTSIMPTKALCVKGYIKERSERPLALWMLARGAKVRRSGIRGSPERNSKPTEVARGCFALPSGTVCCRAIAAIAIVIAKSAGTRFSRQGSGASAALLELAAVRHTVQPWRSGPARCRSTSQLHSTERESWRRRGAARQCRLRHTDICRRTSA
jgi:hypothetical protein